MIKQHTYNCWIYLEVFCNTSNTYKQLCSFLSVLIFILFIPSFLLLVSDCSWFTWTYFQLWFHDYSRQWSLCLRINALLSAKSFVCRITSKTVSSKRIRQEMSQFRLQALFLQQLQFQYFRCTVSTSTFFVSGCATATLIFLSRLLVLYQEFTIEMDDFPFTVSDTISLNSRCSYLRLPFTVSAQKNPANIRFNRISPLSTSK